MKQLVLLLILVGMICPSAHSQCSETEETKVLLVGDSWAFMMALDQTINNALANWGHSDKKFFTNLTLSENGAETDDFQKPEKQAEIAAQLDSFPSIEVVHLSIGGNDVLGDWDISWSQGRTDSLADQVFERLLDVIDFIKNTRPGIRILWGGYTYPNFEEVIESSNPFQTIHPFYGIWEGMGFPSFEQINILQNAFSQHFFDYAQTDSQVDYIPATGILQYTFGQADSLLVAPYGAYPAQTVPLPFGDPIYPSPMNSMRDYLVTKDCFHLSAPGYLDFVEYHIQKFYHKFFMDDHYVLASGGTESGSVAASGQTSSELQLGDMNGDETAVILSFPSAGIADTTFTKASLFLRRESLVGSNPSNDPIEVDLINGNFGSTTNIESGDFSENPDITRVACVFGATDDDGNWIRLDLPVEMFEHITAGQQLQFRLRAPSTSGALITFSNSDNPEFAPVLNLKYGTITTGLEEIERPLTDISVYPNPTNGIFTIKTSGETIEAIEVFDLLGRLMFRTNNQSGKLNLDFLPSGTYNLAVRTGNTIATEKLVIH